jgi:hypothetical protein
MLQSEPIAKSEALCRRIGAGQCRVEERRGCWGHAASLRFLSPLIEPDMQISRIKCGRPHLMLESGLSGSVRGVLRNEHPLYVADCLVNEHIG